MTMTDRHEVRCVLLNYVYMENPEGQSLTSMAVCAGRTVIVTTDRREHRFRTLRLLRIWHLEQLSDRRDGPAGRT
ncbi:hypothetical protein, partial [Acinetobacter baumannii]|uniref:hypothetical protein n=1 Tax=Acinetobacter baumannii TaxID=470 RepID=UPI003397D761